MKAEYWACREGVCLIDMSSYTKLEMKVGQRWGYGEGRVRVMMRVRVRVMVRVRVRARVRVR